MKHIVQFSGGKDSTCMLLMMLEKGMPVDDIIFCDTGMEFPQMYEHIEKVEQYIGRKITRLKPKHDYEFFMFEYIRTRGKMKGEKGFGWATMKCRWCTEWFKVEPTRMYLQGQKHLLYIGIAYDEPKRHEKRRKNVIHPLFDWGITEKMALSTCYKHGFTWGGVVRKIQKGFMLVLPTATHQRIKETISRMSCVVAKVERNGQQKHSAIFQCLWWRKISCRLQCAGTGRQIQA